MLRRTFLALPLFVAAAYAEPPSAWYLGDVVAKGKRGTIRATRFGASDVHVKLGAKVTAREITLSATDNENTLFSLSVVVAPPVLAKELYLQVGDTWFGSDAVADDEAGAQAVYTLARVDAVRVAKALGTPLRERTKIGEGVQGTWTFPSRVTQNETSPLTVRLRVKNTGAETVGFAVAGSHRGLRDNRFEFTITRNGTPVAVKEMADLGLMQYFKTLKTGDEHELFVDLRSWIDLAGPGQYRVDAVFRGLLAKDGVKRATLTDSSTRWDLRLTGQGSILVQ